MPGEFKMRGLPAPCNGGEQYLAAVLEEIQSLRLDLRGFLDSEILEELQGLRADLRGGAVATKGPSPEGLTDLKEPASIQSPKKRK